MWVFCLPSSPDSRPIYQTLQGGLFPLMCTTQSCLVEASCSSWSWQRLLLRPGEGGHKDEMVSYHVRYPKIEEDQCQKTQQAVSFGCEFLWDTAFAPWWKAADHHFLTQQPGSMVPTKERRSDILPHDCPIHRESLLVLLQDSIALYEMRLPSRNPTETHRMSSICCLVLQLCLPPGLHFLAARSATAPQNPGHGGLAARDRANPLTISSQRPLVTGTQMGLPGGPGARAEAKLQEGAGSSELWGCNSIKGFWRDRKLASQASAAPHPAFLSLEWFTSL